MPKRCAVLGCKSKDNKTSLFCVPREKNSWDLFLAWIKATGNPKFLNMGHHEKPKLFICQKHFTDEECALLKMRTKNCVPTLNLPEPLNLDFGIDANIPKSTDSHLVSARQLELENPISTEAEGLLPELTGMTEMCNHLRPLFYQTEVTPARQLELENPLSREADTNKGLLAGLTGMTEMYNGVTEVTPPKPKPVFFPLFHKGSSVGSLNRVFGMGAADPEEGGTHMLSSQQKRKESPSTECSTRRKLLTEGNMVQQLSGNEIDEIAHDTKHAELSNSSTPRPNIKCVDLRNLTSSSSLHSESPESDVDGEITSDIPEDLRVHIRHCMLFEFHKGSSETVATKNICDVYPRALDVRECQRWFSKFKSGNFNLSDLDRSGEPPT